MPDSRKRVVTGMILGVVLAFTLVACDSGDDPTSTTPPGDSDTTSPVGS